MISVVIPTYNRAQTIRMAVDSVLNQTYRDIELIMMLLRMEPKMLLLRSQMIEFVICD